MRGRVDLIVNSSFWMGAALGSGGALVLLNGSSMPPRIARRFAFILGPVIGLGILLLRPHVPESPRWLLVHGRQAEAERIVPARAQGVRGELRLSHRE